MRWALLILVGICTASATWMNMNRMGQKLQRAGDLDDDDLDSPSEFDWSDDETDDMMDDDGMYPRNRPGPRKANYPRPSQHQHTGHRSMEEWEDKEMQFGLPYQQRQHKRRQSREEKTCHTSTCPMQKKPFPFEMEDDLPMDTDEEEDYGRLGKMQLKRRQLQGEDEEDMDEQDAYRRLQKMRMQRQQQKKLGQMQGEEDTDEEGEYGRMQKMQLKRQQQMKRRQFQGEEDTDEEDEYGQGQKIKRQQQKSRGQVRGDEEEDMDDEGEYGRQQKMHMQRQQQKRRLLHGEEEGQGQEQGECKPNYDAMRKLAQVNAQLASKLHKEAKELNDDKNTAVSPVALQLVLAALKEGAKGETKTQIGHILNVGTGKKQDRNAHVALAKSLKGQGPEHGGSKSAVIKCSANIIFRQQSAQERFVHSIKNCFDADVKRCDFKKQPHQCRDQINKWVMGKQDQKLQSVLTHDAITANTEMISIGTMQVKANWARQIKKTMKIVKGRFHPLGDEKPVSVKMLQTNGEFNYFEDDKMEVIGIQTQEDLLTVYIILPKDRHGLNELEKRRLQYGKQLQEIIQQADTVKQTLKVQLPVFQIVHRMETKNMLRKLGTVDPFDLDDADFGGISDDKDTPVLKYGQRHVGGLEDVTDKKDKAPLHINQLIQQAAIQINENGIDVANVQFQHQQTGRLKYEEGENVDENKQEQTGGKGNQLKVEHAFAFMVKHNPSNQLLLIGRVVDPTEEYEQEKQQNQNRRGDMEREEE